jgi:hypothetical protein
VSKVLHVIRSFSDSIPPFMILLSLGYASSSIYFIDRFLGALVVMVARGAYQIDQVFSTCSSNSH